MTPSEAAKRLDGGEYGKEGSKELFAEMKAAGLVAVFGASDDLMEFRGAVYEEVGAFEGTEVGFTRDELLQNECREEECPYFAKLEKTATPVKAYWDQGGFSWTYETTIPHETFVINEDGEPYCRGIVFALADVPSAPADAAVASLKEVREWISNWSPSFEQDEEWPAVRMRMDAALAKAESA